MADKTHKAAQRAVQDEIIPGAANIHRQTGGRHRSQKPDASSAAPMPRNYASAPVTQPPMRFSANWHAT